MLKLALTNFRTAIITMPNDVHKNIRNFLKNRRSQQRKIKYKNEQNNNFTTEKYNKLKKLLHENDKISEYEDQ